MDAVTRRTMLDLDRALNDRDEDQVMALAGVGRITARFMIAVALDDIQGDTIVAAAGRNGRATPLNHPAPTT